MPDDAALATGPVLVYVTAPDMDVASRIARALVDEQLASGVNILPGVRSIYRWKGEVFDEPELFMVMQTRRERFEALRQRVLALHPYDVPKIISVDIAQGHAPYLDWIAENVP